MARGDQVGAQTGPRVVDRLVQRIAVAAQAVRRERRSGTSSISRAMVIPALVWCQGLVDRAANAEARSAASA
jgi:hypothetical protein